MGLTSHLGHTSSATAQGKPLQSHMNLPRGRGVPVEPLRPPPRPAQTQRRAPLPGSRREEEKTGQGPRGEEDTPGAGCRHPIQDSGERCGIRKQEPANGTLARRGIRARYLRGQHLVPTLDLVSWIRAPAQTTRAGAECEDRPTGCQAVLPSSRAQTGALVTGSYHTGEIYEVRW